MPPGKYQPAAVVLWQGAEDQPAEPWTAWLTATPPPETVTVWDSQDPDERGGMVGVTTARAGTATAACTVAPASLTAVTVAATERAVVLVRMRKPGARPDPVDWPVQYQAEDSALGALTRVLGAAGAPPGAGASGLPAAMPTPATTNTTTASTTHRRSLTWWAGLTVPTAW